MMACLVTELVENRPLRKHITQILPYPAPHSDYMLNPNGTANQSPTKGWEMGSPGGDQGGGLFCGGTGLLEFLFQKGLLGFISSLQRLVKTELLRIV